MGEHVVAAEVGLGVPGRLAGGGAGHDERLHRVGHRVAVGAVAVPGLEREVLAHLVVDEGLGRLDAGVEALHVADLEDLAGTGEEGAEALDLLDGDAERLLAEDVLAGFERHGGGLDVEGVGGGDDDGVDGGVGQHLGVVGVGLLRRPGGGHAGAEVVGHVADGVEVGVARLGGGLEMRRLGDRAAAEHAHPEALVVLGGHRGLPGESPGTIDRRRPEAQALRRKRAVRVPSHHIGKLVPHLLL